ncbi:rhamnulokinase [Ruminococcaceae bacterium OttesenSCG-928-L11]|nr:rhamnulokinase [Ruminococcaceae bacterium OttesenSCG-928-L11]
MAHMGKRILAFDFGASSGRAMLADYSGGKITIEEIHRFSNDPVMLNGVLYWDFPRQMHEIKQGILKAWNSGGFDTIGIDTWGVDFGLLDKRGDLLRNPVHYRDERNVGMMEEIFSVIPRDKLYRATGIQFMDINTICQLHYLKSRQPELLEQAETLLFMPDLMAYMLTGEAHTEYSIASTSQLLNAEARDWDWEIVDALGLPRRIFTPIVQPGAQVGMLSQAICDELGVKPVPVIAVGEHDTASAVAAVPARTDDFIYISCGTWSLFGTELDAPRTDDKAFGYNMTNEGGCNNTIRFLKNIIGLWLIQESRRQWMREGSEYSYAQLETEALAAEPFRSFIDPDHPSFVPQGNIPERVRDFCRSTGQPVPETVGQVMRCIYESIALKYRNTFDMLKDTAGKSSQVIHLVGGGTKDNLLCRMTANSCNVPVVAGPIEATVLGNVAVQLIAVGEIADIREARRIIGDSQALITYEPDDADSWQTAYGRFRTCLGL